MFSWHVVWFYAHRFGYKSAEHKEALKRYALADGYAFAPYGAPPAQAPASVN